MKSTLMIFRLAMLIALLVGLGGLFGFYPMSPLLRDVHIVAGIIVLVAVAWLTFQVKNAVVGIAALLILAGGLLPLLSPADPLSVRIFHLVIMIVAVGLAEMGVGRATRTQKAG